jgi:hypothetical protein
MKILKKITGAMILLTGAIYGVYELVKLTGDLKLVLNGILVATIITIVVAVGVFLLAD